MTRKKHKQKHYLWLEVTKDIYRLPIAVATSPNELANMTGTTANNIRSSIYHTHKNGCHCRFEKVEVTEREWLKFRNPEGITK